MRAAPWAVAALAAVLVSFTHAEEPKKLQYPATKKGDVVDDYHGTKVADPYRWLEDDVRKSKDVAEWVEAQNKVTFGFLEGIAEREPIKKRITDLWNYEKISAPSKHGGRYFFFKNDGLQNQSVLYAQDSLTGEPTLLMDPNAWTKDGTVALSGLEVRDDAKFIAYGTAEAGSDWNVWKIFDVTTGKTLSDELKWVKFSNTSWSKDGKGFYYSRFPEPESGAAFQNLNVDMKLYYHVMGQPQSADKLIYERKDNPKWTIGGGVTEDGKYLVISIGDGTTSRKVRIAYQDLSAQDNKVVELIDNHDNKFNFLGNDGSVFYFQTDYDAPKYQIVAIDTKNPDKKNWKTIIPEAKEVLESVDLVGNRFICSYLKDAKSLIKVYEVDGKFVRDVELPGIGTASGFGGKRTDTETFYTFSSFATPTSRSTVLCCGVISARF